MLLAGADLGNQSFKQGRMGKVGADYIFPDLPPGNYRLTGSAIRPDLPLWDLAVTIGPGKVTVPDLGNGNSSARPDALANRGHSS